MYPPTQLAQQLMGSRDAFAPPLYIELNCRAGVWPGRLWVVRGRTHCAHINFINAGSVDGAHSAVQLQAAGSWKRYFVAVSLSASLLSVSDCAMASSQPGPHGLVTATVLTSAPPTGATTASATVTQPTPTVAPSASAGGKKVYWQLGKSTLGTGQYPPPPPPPPLNI